MTISAVERRKTPLLHFLDVQAGFDASLNVLLTDAAAAAEAHLKRLEGDEAIGRTIRARQIRAAQAEINRELARMWDRTGDLIRADQRRAAAAAIDAMYDPLIPLLEGVGYDAGRIDAMLRSQQATAARGVRNAVSRVTLTKIPLSSQVYKTKALTSGQLDRIITSAIARGVSARELGDLVRPFIRPDTPGGVKYAAQRLGRTELNNAFHGTQVQAAAASPFVIALQWQLSGSHPRPDMCNEYADGGDLGGGLWSPDEVPGKPHPNCLCYMEPKTPDRQEFLRRYQAGEYDSHFADDLGLEDAGSAGVPAWAKAADPRAAERQRTRLESTFRRAPSRGKNAIPSDQFVARHEYTESLHGRTLNSILRGGSDPTLLRYVDDAAYVRYAKMEKSLNAAIDRAELTEDVVVGRGVIVTDTFNPGTLKAGDHLADPGFLSTTTNLDEAKNFASGRGGFTSDGSDPGWVFITRAPKGTKAIHGADYQQEILFKSGTTQRVVHVDSENRTIYTELT